MTEDKKILDSGERREFDSGAVRDMAEGKGRFDLLPFYCIWRMAKHYERGAKKYGEHNWEKGIPAHSYLDSAFRHLIKYAMGWDDEPHLEAAVFNIFGLMHIEDDRPEYQDLPAWSFDEFNKLTGRNKQC